MVSAELKSQIAKALEPTVAGVIEVHDVSEVDENGNRKVWFFAKDGEQSVGYTASIRDTLGGQINVSRVERLSK